MRLQTERRIAFWCSAGMLFCALFAPALAFAQPAPAGACSISVACKASKFTLLAGHKLCLNGTTCATWLDADASTIALTLQSGTSNTATPAVIFDTTTSYSGSNLFPFVFRSAGTDLAKIGYVVAGVPSASFSGLIQTGSDAIISGAVKSSTMLGQSANPLRLGSQGAADGSTQVQVGGYNNLVNAATHLFSVANNIISGTPTEVSFVDLAGNIYATNGGLAVPSVHGATAAQSIERGSGAATAGGVLAVTFGTAFGAAPVCTCADQNAAPVSCGISTAANTTSVTFTIGAARADTVTWICTGQK